MAANLRHRNTRHTRYDLRGPFASGPVVYQKTDAQVASDRVASRIKKKWPITRNSKRTRGLERHGMSCFRLSGIQGLLHLPKFLNWILSHNTSITNKNGTTSIHFPCRPLEKLGQAIADKARYTGASPVRLKDCPACVVKRFAEMYWGQTDLLPEKTRASGLPADRPEHRPRSFPHRSRAMNLLRNLDQSLQGVPSGTIDYEQQDPSEFQARILQACCASTEDTLWSEQFKALFQTQLKMEWICAKCNTVTAPPMTNDPLSLGIAALPILHPDDGPDSIDEAIRRLYSDEVFDGTFDCATCGDRQGRIERKRLNVAPELLRIGIAVQMILEEQKTVDGEMVVERTSAVNPNPVAIPLQLDLADYQAVAGPKAPLQYQLDSVLSHGGTVDEGHWVATVSGETGIFTADDADVVSRERTHFGKQVRDKTFLNSNPQVISGLPMKAVILTYSRIRTRGIA